MKPGMWEIERLCIEVINAGGTRISIDVPKDMTTKIKGFGRGELLCTSSEGNRIVSYDVMKVLNAMRKMR